MSVKSNGDSNTNQDGVWYDWTPFFKPSFYSTATLINGRYCRLGNIVNFTATFKIDGPAGDVGTNSGDGKAIFLLPTNAKLPSTAANQVIGTSYYTLGTPQYVGTVLLQPTDGFTDGSTTYTGSAGILQYYKTASSLSNPITKAQLTNIDPVTMTGVVSTISFSGTYEAA